MKSGGRLVQHVERLTGIPAGKLGSELYPLRLAARQLGGGLTQPYIAQAHVIQGLQLALYFFYGTEELKRFLHRHIQYVGNAPALVFYLKSFTVIPFALAYLAGHIYVRQEVHLYFEHAVAVAGLTPSSLYVEAEAAVAVAPHLRIGRHGEYVAYHIEKAGICSRVAAGRAAYGGLVYVYYLIQLLYSLYAVAHVLWDILSPVQIVEQCLLDDLIHQAALAAAGYPCNAGEHAKGYVHIYIFKVVYPCALYPEPLVAVAAPAFRQGYEPASG